MANDENKIEISQEEKRKRDYMDDLDAQKAKELIDRINKQREETLKSHREKVNTAEAYKSYGSHGLDFSGHDNHGINEVQNKIHSSESDAEYMRQMSENYRARRQMERNSSETGSASAFSSYGVGKVNISHIENGEVTFSGSRHTSAKDMSDKPDIKSPNKSVLSLPTSRRDYSEYTARTINNSRHDYTRQEAMGVQDSVPELSREKPRFQYSKHFLKNAAYTTERIYTTAGKTVYRLSAQRGDYDTIHNAEQMRRGAIGTVAAVSVIRGIPHNIVARASVIGSYTHTTLGNISRYIKGTNSAKISEELESIRNFIGPLSLRQTQRYEFLENELDTISNQLHMKINHVTTIKQYRSILDKYGELSKLSATQINKEIRVLQKLKKTGRLNAAQKIRLEKLTELNSLHTLKDKLHKNIRSRRELSIAFSRLIHQTMSKTEDSGINGFLSATDFCTNRYTRTIIREIAKLDKFIAQTAVHYGAKGVMFISDKTGLTKQVSTLKTQATKKLMSTKTVSALNTLKGKINGEIYSEVRKKISSKMPSSLKTAVKNTNSAVSKIKTTSNKVSKAVRRGYNIITKPFAKIKSVAVKVMKIAKGAVLASGGLLLLFFVMFSVASAISSATSSVILEDVENLNEYIQVLNDEQTQFKQTLTSLGSGYRNVVYEYTDGSKMNNTREILCMATVYLQQDFEDKNAVKAYLRQMFNASHFYSTQESPTYYCSDGEGCDNHKREIIKKSDGTKETKYVCQGHKDLTVTITALTFDEIFNTSVNATGVGDLCFAFETGGRTLGSYNVWYCEDIHDGTGMNYGMMSANRGQATNMWNYIKANSPSLAGQFAGVDGFTGDNLHPFSNAFNARWKGAHTPEETAEMEKLQRAWVWNAYGAIWCADLKSKTGVDMTRSWALKEVALSRAVHRGAYSAKSFYSCVNSSMTDEQIIDAIYDHECSTLSSFMSRWNLERTYAKSFLGRAEPTADGSSDQFTWDEGNIEWCKNLYEQDWEELYEGLVGLNSITVGSSMTEAEVEALIGSIDGLSQERKNILSWACSAVGKIPYHWDWRSYWTIDAEDWGTPCTPDYKGRSLKGLDCSGFVVWCYNKSGYDPITCGWGSTGWTGSIADSPKTIKISQSELKPGDIGMTGAYPYTHTGIYAGNGKWIHCTGAPTNNTVCNSYGGFKTFYRMTDLD